MLLTVLISSCYNNKKLSWIKSQVAELELIISRLKSFNKKRPLDLIKSDLEAERILQMKL